MWSHFSTKSIINSFLRFYVSHCYLWLGRDSKTWSAGGIEGVYRFLGRSWRLVVGQPLPDGSFKDGTVAIAAEPTLEQLRALHRCIEKVTEEIEGTRFNTGISAMMEFINAAYKVFILNTC
ncbi:hypothetical protein GIB67_032161 [Kingdonia uniflora]|uniref:leucine--tRNA ligase n=1 Tax=Kingdonia uniflora TaxID=39325 RepID=A0A7J7MX83_9MAGN|nr:hypothetical protein GIB67_032161 [Kingdonia uniflora]